jgi:hypothetical protein
MPPVLSITRRLRSGLVALFLLGSSTGIVQAGLHFEETTVQLGEVRAGTPLVHEFRFVNDGPETVALLEARSSCGCLRPSLPCRLLAPGAKAALRVEVNTLTQAAGSHTWQVHLFYQLGQAGPRQRSEETDLTVSAKIVAELTIQPVSLTLFTREAVSQEVVLTDLRERPLTEIKLATSSPQLTARLRESGQDATGHAVFHIGLQVSGNFPEGRHEEMLDIYTRDPLYPHLRLPVTVVRQARQRLSVLPAEVVIRATPGQPLPSQLLRIADSAEEAVVIESITADDPAIRCRWAAGPGRCATVRIQIGSDRLRGTELHTTVHIRLSRPLPETLEVPVQCVVE